LLLSSREQAQLATLAEEHRQQVEANAAQKRQLEAKEREIEKLLAGGAEAAACKALKKEISQQQGRELALLADMRKVGHRRSRCPRARARLCCLSWFAAADK
jgi:predicted  nucleic acid-binding Zn-ribbon protein